MSLNISIDVPDDAPEQLSAEALVGMLKGPQAGGVAVIDVRSDPKGGSIKGSMHIPVHLILAETEHYAAQFAHKEALVFVSAKSPDLDVTAAVPMQQQLRVVGGKAPAVYILVDGVVGWMQAHGGDDDLADGFQPKAYGTSRLKVNRRGSVKRNLRVDVPQAPCAITASSLQVMLEEEHTDTVVVDVRYVQEGGTIPGSVHVPHTKIVAQPMEYAELWGDKSTVIFVSLLSPDLDLTAATAFMQANADLGGTASVLTLIGGLKGWMPSHRTNPKLVVHYDPTTWEAPDAPAAAKAGNSLRARRGSEVGMRVEVPEVPHKMGGQELAVLLKGSSGSPRRAVRYQVVDVRDCREGGHITDSVYIPHHELVRDLAAHADAWKALSLLIFYSNVSPDLDENVATAALHALRDRHSDVEVCTLHEGFRGWVANCYHNPILVTDFDAKKWPDVRPRPDSADAPGKKNRPTLGITVPESPLSMAPQALTLLLKSKSESIVVVDVREVPEGGTITGSAHVPASALTADIDRYAKEWAQKDMIVFVSQQPSCLDVSAATPMMQAVRAAGSNAQVFTLLGGMHSWIPHYEGDASLVSGL